MHSSAAVAGRALIMLACVVGIPAIALSGTSWSEILKKLQDFHWSTLLDFASTSSSASPKDSMPMAGPSGPDRGGPGTAPPAIATSPITTSLPLQTSSPQQSSVVPAGFQSSAEPVATQSAAVVAGEAASAATSADPFHSIQVRLRQLGATYYLLESWGTDERLFRFYCKVAIGGSADYTRYFESTQEDPLQAMCEVLRRVESWRQGGAGRSERNSANPPQQAGATMPGADSNMPHG